LADWKKYNGAIVPDTPPHLSLDIKDLASKIKEQNAFFARWTSDFDIQKESEFWHVICDDILELSDYSGNTRSKINRGLKQCDVRIIHKDLLIESGYDVYMYAFQKYKTYLNAKTKQEFITEIEEKQSDWQFWGVFYNNKIIAYSKNKIVDDYCEYASIKFHPSYLRYYPSYALFYVMNRYYLKENNFRYVNDGVRSISHSTNIQDFLIHKFKFRKAYCKLHILYNYRVRIFVAVLFPFRRIIRMFNFGPFVRINILFFQEEINRRQA
tara:strand:+ start:1678 stop:2481 length:804 start_codon:yes stop_codon:yes gene_type:complete